MIDVKARVDERALVAALHALGPEHIMRFVRELLIAEDDQALLEDCADMLLKELERRASGRS